MATATRYAASVKRQGGEAEEEARHVVRDQFEGVVVRPGVTEGVLGGAKEVLAVEEGDDAIDRGLSRHRAPSGAAPHEKQNPAGGHAACAAGSRLLEILLLSQYYRTGSPGSQAHAGPRGRARVGPNAK